MVGSVCIPDLVSLKEKRMPFDGYVLHPGSGEVALNMKQIIEDNNADARRRHSNAADFDKAMNTFTLSTQADLHTLRYLSTIGTLIAGQTGETENQSNTSPMGQAAAEANKGAVGVADAVVATANSAVAASIGNLATAAVSLITATGGVVTAQSLAAILPILVTAVGGASTPSQTQAKPTT
jgi:hypothetical protein